MATILLHDNLLRKYCMQNFRQKNLATLAAVATGITVLQYYT